MLFSTYKILISPLMYDSLMAPSAAETAQEEP
jgi:hypothetical protein